MSVDLEQNLELAVSASWQAKLGDRARGLLGEGAWRGSLAILDQALVSGSRFLTTILLGRFAGAFELGNYARGFTTIVLAACVQETLVALPLAIYGNRRSGDDGRRFAGSVLTHSLLLSLLGSAILAAIAAAIYLLGDTTGLLPLFAILAVTLPLTFVVEFARRYCLARLDLIGALSVDTAMAALQLGGLAALAALGWLSAITALVCIAIAGAIVGGIWLATYARQFIVERAAVVADGIHNWAFGSWIMASQLALVMRGMALPWMLSAIINPAAAGVFAACETVSLLANPLLLAISNVLAPQAAREFVDGGTQAVRRLITKVTLLLSIGTVSMCAAFILGGGKLLVLLFGPEYVGLDGPIALLALSIVVEGVGMPVTSGLLAIEKSRITCIAYLLGSVAALGLWLLLIEPYGLLGAAWGSLVGRSVTSAALCLAFARFTSVRRREEPQR